MSNLYDALKGSNAFRKIEIDDLLFVEYSCDPGGPKTDIWSHHSYFTYVVSGRMNLKMADRVYEIRAGEAYFITRGGFIVPEFYEEVFCDMIIFLPDDFIRSVIDKYQIRLAGPETGKGYEAVIPLQLDPSLIQYYRSLFTYLQSPDPPSRILMKIKLEELIVNILTRTNNPILASYFSCLHKNVRPSIKEIMEANFTSNLSMAEFARLSARSLSTFRREFSQLYRKTPGEWLRDRRLEYGKYLLETTTDPVDEIAFESGFSSRTHFIRIFKKRFHLSPHQFRQNHSRQQG
jgi:AraC family transcriptional regulator, exoenzyme S synthesis regulatory protein ExsA